MSEAKDQEQNKRDKNELLDLVQEFCTSEIFEQEFEMFAKENADIFEQSLNFTVHESEHPMEFYKVYRDYLTKFESLIENFIVKNGFSVKTFYEDCQDVLETEGVFGRRRFFIETMLATSEYEHFFILMQSEMRLRAAAKGK